AKVRQLCRMRKQLKRITKNFYRDKTFIDQAALLLSASLQVYPTLGEGHSLAFCSIGYLLSAKLYLNHYKAL
ncbi:MAG TPA: hypothetical protein VKC90_07950, partial [Chitinophagaceae bacterium]|nr:hypothetical protein [Chitinophagaceae bacterium]